MSYYMICPNCGKGTIGRYAADDSLCGECSDNSSTTDKLSVEKLQERCDRYEQVLTEISKTKDFYRSGCDHWEEFSQDALKAQHVLKEFV